MITDSMVFYGFPQFSPSLKYFVLKYFHVCIHIYLRKIVNPLLSPKSIDSFLTGESCHTGRFSWLQQQQLREAEAGVCQVQPFSPSLHQLALVPTAIQRYSQSQSAIQRHSFLLIGLQSPETVRHAGSLLPLGKQWLPLPACEKHHQIYLEDLGV